MCRSSTYHHVYAIAISDHDASEFGRCPLVLVHRTYECCFHQGNITKWKKKVGDQVSPGQVLAEVETDKATIDWEAQEDGFIAKLLVPDDTKDIPLGTAVAVLVEEQSDVAAFKNFTVGGALHFLASCIMCMALQHA